MDPNGLIELRFGNSSGHCSSEPLNNLASLSPHHVNTEYSVGGRVHHQLHQTLLIATG